jgi:hypothetical protein
MLRQLMASFSHASVQTAANISDSSDLGSIASCVA